RRAGSWARIRLHRHRHPRARPAPDQRQLRHRRAAGVRPVSADGARGGRGGDGSRMKYFIQISGQTHQVPVEGGHVVVDGQSFEAHLAAIPGTPMHHLLLGGESWTVAAPRLDEGAGDSPVYTWALGAAGERLEVEAVD